MTYSQESGQSVSIISDMPINCAELENFTKTVLDSSFFFKENVPLISEKLLVNPTFESCEFQPHLLTITGFQKYISNDVLESRYDLLKADSLYISQNDFKHKFYIRNKIFLGLNYNLASDTIKSLRYLREAESMSIKTNNQRLLIDTRHNIGVVYLNIGLIEKAEFYLDDVTKLLEQTDNQEVEGFANLTYSQIYRINKEHSKALDKVENARKVFKELDDQRNLYLVEMYKSDILMDQGKLKEAILGLKKAERLGNESNHYFQHGHIYMSLGKLYEKTNSEKSIQYYENAFKNSSQLNKSEFSSTIATLTNYYIKSKNYKKQNALILGLAEIYKQRQVEMEVELKESNQREIEIQKEIIQNEILVIENEQGKKRVLLITLASLICLLFAFYAIYQWATNQRLNKKISIQNMELKNFASMASHDLKAPVQSISNFTTLIKAKLPEDINPDIPEFLEIIGDSSDSMNKLVNSLLKYSTLENKEIDVQTINTSKMIGDVLNNLFSIVESKNAEVQVSEKLPISIQGDETLLKIVFQNLINNALKFVAPDKTPNIYVDYEDGLKEHKFKVIDNGIGIDKKYLDKVFLMFQRLHSSSEFEGSGIGLATCQKIVQLHKGNISIESVPNQGSTFTFTVNKEI